MKAKPHIPYLVLATKLSIPQSPVRLVRRDRLMNKMNHSRQCKLTIVVAPTGFGKSIFVSDWLRHMSVPLRAGWLSLDNGENDLERFWHYVILSLDKDYPGIGQKALSLMQTMISVSIEHVVTLFINDLCAIDDSVMLVWDDYHLIHSEEVHRSVQFFLERMPNHVHLCIISRTNPPLQIGGLCAKGLLNELDILDLKFTEEEISAYWLLQMNARLTSEQVSLLADRTEGWIAGIQLASISNTADLNYTLSRFSGQNRYVVDYLMEDVIRYLRSDIKEFLFQTSILEKMNEDLCAAVTGIPKEKKLLEHIEQANIFLIKLDKDGYWYRYHHLFLDFLRSRAKQEATGTGADDRTLHQRASSWYEQYGYLEEAIEHALAAGEYTKAAELIQQHSPEMFKKRQLSTMSGWFERMPDTVSDQVGLLIIQVYTELLSGRVANAGQLIERLKLAAAEMSVASNSITELRLQEEVYISLSFLAWMQRDYETIYQRIEDVYNRDSVPGQEIVQDLIKNVVHLDEGCVPLIRGFYGFDGKLRQAESFLELYARFVSKHQLQRWHYVAYPYTALSEVYYEKNKLDLAYQYADLAMMSASVHGNIGAYVPAVIVRAQVYQAWEQPQRQLEVISAAMKKLQQQGDGQSHWYDLLHACLARYMLDNGSIEQAERWMNQSNISEDEDAAAHQSYEIATLIRILIAKRKYQEALNWAERMRSAASRRGLVMTRLESHLLIAVIHDGTHHAYESMIHLHQALVLGEEEGYIRTLVSIKELSPNLLDKYVLMRKKKYIPAIQQGVSAEYIHRLQVLSLSVRCEAGASEQAEPEQEISSEYELTAREIEVLKSVCAGLSNKEIAEQLVLTVGTVKLHLNRIYSKLGVKNRMQAMQKASHLL